MSQELTVEQLKEALPKHLKTKASQELVDKVNGVANDPEMAREIRENFLTYTKVLQEGRFKTEDYLNAVAYCTYKLMGYSNKDAYAKAFPDRWNLLALKGTSDKDISAYVAMYHKNKLVNMILDQAMIPSWLLNQDAFQKAINVQVELMTSSTSDKVRRDAADSILTHLKPPEVAKVQVDMNVRQEGGIADLMATLTDLAKEQKRQIEAGGSAREIGRVPLVIEAERVPERVSTFEARVPEEQTHIGPGALGEFHVEPGKPPVGQKQPSVGPQVPFVGQNLPPVGFSMPTTPEEARELEKSLVDKGDSLLDIKPRPEVREPVRDSRTSIFDVVPAPEPKPAPPAAEIEEAYTGPIGNDAEDREPAPASTSIFDTPWGDE